MPTATLANLPSLKQLKKEQWLDLSKKGSKAKTWGFLQAVARHEGKKCLFHNAESTNPHTRHKSDAFGILDIIMVEPGRIRGIQACSQDWQPHIAKFREHRETVRRWLMPGNTTLELWGWRKVKRNGRMTYRPRVQLITLAFLDGDEDPNYIQVISDD